MVIGLSAWSPIWSVIIPVLQNWTNAKRESDLFNHEDEYRLNDLSRIPVNKGTNSRVGWTKYSDLYETVHPSFDLISLCLLTGVECGKGLLDDTKSCYQLIITVTCTNSKKTGAFLFDERAFVHSKCPK